ncbi:MAG: hypothetical protein ACI4AM_08695 [Muribaculaceae bacterium]
MKTLILSDFDSTAPQLIADSAVTTDSMPLFVPDGTWAGQVRIAVRIDRLGKSIKERFAERYYGAFTVAHCLMPQHNEIAVGALDQSVIHGRWLPLPEAPVDVAISVGDQTTRASVVIPHAQLHRFISLYSQLATFKTGDIIIPPTPLLQFTLVAPSALSVELNGSNILNFRIL